MADSSSPHFEGLSKTAKLWIVVSAIILSAGCMAWSAYESHIVSSRLQYSADDDLTVLRQMYDEARVNKSTDPFLFVHALNVQTHLKAVSNRHGMSMSALAASLALITVGFALFLIGADGVFQVSAQHGVNAKLAASGTAPGLLCFIAGTVVILSTIWRSTSITLGDFQPPMLASEWSKSGEFGHLGNSNDEQKQYVPGQLKGLEDWIVKKRQSNNKSTAGESEEGDEE